VRRTALRSGRTPVVGLVSVVYVAIIVVVILEVVIVLVNVVVVKIVFVELFFVVEPGVRFAAVKIFFRIGREPRNLRIARGAVLRPRWAGSTASAFCSATLTSARSRSITLIAAGLIAARLASTGLGSA